MQKRTYKEIDGKKKAMAIEFRRWVTWKSSGRQIKDYIGADVGDVREWIESNWLPQMTWANYGTVWVIDHIVPLRMFNLFDEADLKIAWHYKNLMPLLKDDNLKKEGNAFFAFEMLHSLRKKDYFFAQLFERVKPEVQWMIKYINHFHRRYTLGQQATLRSIREQKRKSA